MRETPSISKRFVRTGLILTAAGVVTMLLTAWLLPPAMLLVGLVMFVPVSVGVMMLLMTGAGALAGRWIAWMRRRA